MKDIGKKRVKLGDVCSKDSSNFAQKDLENLDGEYPIYGASGYIKNISTYHQEKEYVAVVKDGAGIGRTMFLPAKSSVIGTLQYLIPNNLVEAKYLYYVVQNMNLGKYFTGATIPHIYFKDYQREEFCLHEKEEQEKIVSILDKVQNLIDLRREQIAQCDLLVKARFVEMFGDPVLNDKGWEIVQLGDELVVAPQNGLYKPSSAYVTGDDGVPILRIDGFYDGKLTGIDNLKRLKCTVEEKEKYALYENDIVINRVNSIEYLGKCALIKGLNEVTVFESNMMRFHVNEERINPLFMTKLLCTKFIYNQILSCAKKAVNQASINQKDVLSFMVIVPPRNLQNDFASFVEKCDSTKRTLQSSLAEAELLRGSLMQRWF